MSTKVIRVRRRLMTLIATCALALAMAACASSSSGTPSAANSQGPIVVGAANAQTGFMSAFDIPAYHGMQIAVAQINASGGVLGRKLELVRADTHSTTTGGATAGDAVVSEGAQFVVTSCDYDLGSPEARAGNAHGVLAVGCAGGYQFGYQGIGPLSFDAYPGSYTEGAVMAEYALQKGWKAPYLINDTSLAYSAQVCSAFSATWNHLAPTDPIVGTETMQNTQSSFAAQVSRLSQESKKTGVVVVCSYPPGGASMVRGIRQAGISQPILGSGAFDGTYWVGGIPGLSNFYYPALGSIYGDDPASARMKFFATYTRDYGPPASGTYPLLGYSAVETIATGIRLAHSTAGSSVAAAIDTFHDVNLLTGPVSYTTTCHIPRGMPYLLQQIQHGKGSYTGVTIKPSYVPPSPC